MQGARPRASRLHEFVAHEATVNCLQIGRKSASVMVTGGDDKRVNVWAICAAGRADCIASLSGHTSGVECVAFDTNEQTVIGGSAGGTLKLWDLEQGGKIARTLTGHRSHCVAVQWHPYGEFFASGSTDTSLKIWDIRRKSCIQTYKGHHAGVRQIEFAPDGRWVASGDDDGFVKLWDLTAGKMVHEWAAPAGTPGPVTAIAMHPNEFLMATGGGDRSLRLCDLETFEIIGQTPSDSAPVRCARFSTDGSALLGGADDSLKVWGWEPLTLYEGGDVRWGRLADMSVTPQGGLIGASLREATAAVWGVGLASMVPADAAAPEPILPSSEYYELPPTTTHQLERTLPQEPAAAAAAAAAAAGAGRPSGDENAPPLAEGALDARLALLQIRGYREKIQAVRGGGNFRCSDGTDPPSSAEKAASPAQAAGGGPSSVEVPPSVIAAPPPFANLVPFREEPPNLSAE